MHVNLTQLSTPTERFDLRTSNVCCRSSYHKRNFLVSEFYPITTWLTIFFRKPATTFISRLNAVQIATDVLLKKFGDAKLLIRLQQRIFPMFPKLRSHTRTNYGIAFHTDKQTRSLSIASNSSRRQQPSNRQHSRHRMVIHSHAFHSHQLTSTRCLIAGQLPQTTSYTITMYKLQS